MDITIRYFDGCPNWRTAEARLREVLAERGLDATEIGLERVGTTEEASAMHFRGSPTILLDGIDPFDAEESGYGLTCRVYRTELGQDGSPSMLMLREAVAAAGG